MYLKELPSIKRTALYSLPTDLTRFLRQTISYVKKKSPVITLFVLFVLSMQMNQAYAGRSAPNRWEEGTAVSIQMVHQTDTSINVSGLVTDSSGAILSGVSVALKSQSGTGTTTDLNGRYVLRVPASGVLVFTMVGFSTQEVPVNSRTGIDVIMLPDNKKEEEVVVTAFGQVRRKQDVIGSVSSLSPKDLRVPASNLTAALQGRVAGMISFQRSGEPGADNADFFIRGVGTFGVNQRPLILIDNMEVDADALARIPVDDIEGFSILKDATAASVYGSRGANGVVIITTKQGKEGPAKISIRADQRWSMPTEKLKTTDPVTYMRMYNEALFTRDPLANRNAMFAEEKIANTAAGNDPINYPAVDWMDMMIKPYTTTQNYNIGISGGSQLAQYNVSGNLTRDNGLLKVDPLNNFNNNVDFKVYNLRSNISMNVTKSTRLGIRAIANLQDYNGPPVDGSEAFRLAVRSSPVLFAPVYHPGATQSYIKHPMFGNFDNGQYLNSFAEVTKGYSERSKSSIQLQVELNQDLSFLIEGLKYAGMLNLTRESYFSQSRTYKPFYYQPAGVDMNGGPYYQVINPESGTEFLNFAPGQRAQGSISFIQNQLVYQRVFNSRHNVKAMAVHTVRNQVSTPVNDEGISLLTSLPYRNVSLSGSAEYSFDNRYHANFSFGYNGSERFDENARWGFFPSFGLAWSVHNEKFMEPLRNVINQLKLRFTHGLLGNDNITLAEQRFFYLSDVNLSNSGRGYTWGIPSAGTTYSRPGISIRKYGNPEISWEVSQQTNFGVDLALFNNTLKFTGEYFNQKRTNVVQERASIPETNGYEASIYANLGVYKSKGFDGELTYFKSFKSSFWMEGRGTFTYATGKYAYYEEPNYQYAYLSRIGLASSQRRGYIAERLFIDDNEVLNSPEQLFSDNNGYKVLGGDIKYIDVNQDGVINQDDMVPIGFPTNPEINYGFGLSTGYKSFDFSFFFSGMGEPHFLLIPDMLDQRHLVTSMRQMQYCRPGQIAIGRSLTAMYMLHGRA